MAASDPLLARVESALPLLADLWRCDVVLYCPDNECARAVAAARPETVPSVYAESRLGRIATRRDEPSVLQVLAGRRPGRRLSHILDQGSPTVQDVLPVVRGGVTVAAVVFEVGVIERERQRRKNPIYRRALERLRDAALEGKLVGIGALERLGEHDGPLVVDSNGQITYISSIGENLYRKLGYTSSLANRNLSHLQTDESAFFEALESGACVQRTAQEGPFTWTRWALPVPSDAGGGLLRRFALRSGRTGAVILIVRDVTHDREKEQELRIKTAMIQEIHHRVKNNLQTIASLLRLQARRTGSAEVGDILRQTINRILSIAVVHEFLALDEANVIDVKEVCQRILNEVTQGILDPEKNIRFTIEGPDLPLPAQQATSCALIVNELLQNAVKHAFRVQTVGNVGVLLSDDGELLRIEIVDDGCGVGPGFERRHAGSLGLQIVRTLVRDDLKGEFTVGNTGESGVRATVTFPKVHRSSRAGDTTHG